MKDRFRRKFLGLLVAISAGFVLDIILWSTHTRYIAPIWCAIGFGLGYLHFRWLQGVNRNKDDVKIKHLV
jgi:hypothetical protein